MGFDVGIALTDVDREGNFKIEALCKRSGLACAALSSYVISAYDGGNSST